MASATNTGMLRVRVALVLALLALSALAAPVGALAQSAGDNQYQDPLAGHSSKGSGGSSGGGSRSAQSTPAATPSANSGTSGSSGSGSTSGAKASAQSGQLPRTGFELLIPVELGLALLLAGATLRRWLTLQSRP